MSVTEDHVVTDAEKIDGLNQACDNLQTENGMLEARNADLEKDRERLDWLQAQSKLGHLPEHGWIARDSVQGRGYRLHEGPRREAEYLGHTSVGSTVREALDKAMTAAH